jgi:hypothetical protein
LRFVDGVIAGKRTGGAIFRPRRAPWGAVVGIRSAQVHDVILLRFCCPVDKMCITAA